MNRQRPRLKNGVDLQLQSAFSDGNWSAVIRLADKRARALKDPYYEMLKICAESQLDDPSVKLVAVSAVSQYIKDGTVIKDLDALDLLEWATLDLADEDDFPETIGPLRVKAAKASPKDRNVTSRCLEACLIHWDLSSAQQIAAVMDRSFPQDRQYMFWNIVITHMLSTSPETPDEKKKLYGTLAFRQIDRAARASEQELSPDTGEAQLPSRRVRTEEEILLLYDIVETHGTKDDFYRIVSSTVFSPLTHFRQGQKELFLRVIAKYKREMEWMRIYQLCRDCLSEEDDKGRPNLLASDYGVWQEFIIAASHIQASDETVLTTIQGLLLKLIKSLTLRPIYRRNLLLARLSASFYLLTQDENDRTDEQGSSARLLELMRYVEDQAMSPACFDDIRDYVEKLDCSGLKYFSQEYLPVLSEKVKGTDSSDNIRLLALKVRYLATTCPLAYSSVSGEQARAKCLMCGTETGSTACISCFKGIWLSGLEMYKNIATKAPGKLSSDPYTPPELALLLAFCSVRLASPDSGAYVVSSCPSSRRHLFHAILLLEYQLSFSPKNSPILLTLVQLHLLVGSSPRSRQLWEELGVKRTIMDSLAPLFYDRLSTIAPALLSPLDNWGWQLMDMLTSHYSYSLKLKMPRRLVDAFEAESYSSILQIPKYITDLRRSATRAMSLVEESRSERFLGAPTWELFSDPRFVELAGDTRLKEVIDYGSFFSWDSSESTQVYARLRLGPPLSARRAQLGLLSEAFHDVLGYKSPQLYKVPLGTSEADLAFVVETLTRIGHSFHRFLEGQAADLTPAEIVYYDILGLLSTLVPLCVERGRTTGFEASFCQLADSIGSGLEALQQQIPYNGSSSVEEVVSLLGSLHTVGIYRDTAKSVLLAAQWIIGLSERLKERDRSGQSNLPKAIISKTKALQSASEAALREGRSWMTGLRAHVRGDFQQKFKKWLFEGADAIRDGAYEDIIPGLVGNIKDNVEGWQQVQWE